MKYTISTFDLSSKACLSWDACGIAENVYERACCDAETLDEAFNNISDALNDELIYTADQWTIMQEYQTPEEANFFEAVDSFYNDLCKYFFDCVTLEED